VARILKAAYAHQRGVGGLITRLRPFICPFEELIRRVIDPVPGRPSSTCGRVLDVGCGVGIMSVLAAEAGASEIVGFDVSARAIDVARGVIVNGVRPRFEVLPPGVFPDGQFDVVLCVDVLHHVLPPEQLTFLDALCAHVAPGGTLLVKDISPVPWRKAMANRMHDLVMARQWIHYRHEEEVAAYLARKGGEIVEKSRLDRLWYGHYLVVWKRT